MHAVGVGCSDVGKEREQNEDSLLVDDALGLYVVADGMGGHSAGEVASQKSVAAVARAIGARRGDLAGLAADGDREKLAELVREAVLTANREVNALALASSFEDGMGCTLTLLLVVGNRAVMAHVGDTRLYLWREGEMSQLSSDHTIANELALVGMIRPDEVRNHQYGHVLTRAVGTSAKLTVDTLVLDVAPGDRFVLCSDGLHQYVEDEPWLARQLDGVAFEATAEELVSFANAAGGEDNVTAVLVRIDAGAVEADIADEMSSELQGRFDALEGVFLFEGLGMGLLQRVLNMCEIRTLAEGEIAIAQGDSCARLMVVLEGRLGVLRDDGDIGELGPGEAAGVTTLLSPRRARGTLRARTPARLLVLERRPFWALVKARPWLGVGLLERLGRRLSIDLDRQIERADDDPQSVSPEPYERI